MGRRKIEIQPITHERNRSVTFLKRKTGLFKKAYEIGVLCSVDIAVIIFEERPGNQVKLFQYCSSDIHNIIQRQISFDGEKDSRVPADFAGLNNAIKLDDIGEGDDDEDVDDDGHEAHVRATVKRRGEGQTKSMASSTESEEARTTTDPDRPLRHATMSIPHPPPMPIPAPTHQYTSSGSGISSHRISSDRSAALHVDPSLQSQSHHSQASTSPIKKRPRIAPTSSSTNIDSQARSASHDPSQPSHESGGDSNIKRSVGAAAGGGEGFSYHPPPSTAHPTPTFPGRHPSPHDHHHQRQRQQHMPYDAFFPASISVPTPTPPPTSGAAPTFISVPFDFSPSTGVTPPLSDFSSHSSSYDEQLVQQRRGYHPQQQHIPDMLATFLNVEENNSQRTQGQEGQGRYHHQHHPQLLQSLLDLDWPVHAQMGEDLRPRPEQRYPPSYSSSGGDRGGGPAASPPPDPSSHEHDASNWLDFLCGGGDAGTGAGGGGHGRDPTMGMGMRVDVDMEFSGNDDGMDMGVGGSQVPISNLSLGKVMSGGAGGGSGSSRSGSALLEPSMTSGRDRGGVVGLESVGVDVDERTGAGGAVERKGQGGGRADAKGKGKVKEVGNEKGKGLGGATARGVKHTKYRSTDGTTSSTVKLDMEGAEAGL